MGYLPASGTLTVALVGVPLFWCLSGLPVVAHLILTLAFSGLAVALHQWGDRVLGEKDSRKLVWDELAGFFVAVIGVPFTWQTAAAAFLLERALDVTKFPPAGWVERRLPGGWGVVGDDLIAGAYTCGVLHLAMRLAPSLLGLYTPA